MKSSFWHDFIYVQTPTPKKTHRKSCFQNQNFIFSYKFFLFVSFSMAWYEIPNTNVMSIYITLVFGVITVVVVFRLWLKATCGKFESNVSCVMTWKPWNVLMRVLKFRRCGWMEKQFWLPVPTAALVKRLPEIWQSVELGSSWHVEQWKLPTKPEVSRSFNTNLHLLLHPF